MRTPHSTSNICSVIGCGKPVLARGWCSMHYQRWRRHGDANFVLFERAPNGVALRWLYEIAIPFRGSECLDWPFGKSGGYGEIWLDGRHDRAHRFICETVHGPPPTPEHEAAHNCGRPSCCNPSHLRWATIAENSADRLAHGTATLGERHGQSVLTEDDVRQIREFCASGMLQQDVADIFRVGPATVSLIVRRKLWRHVD